MVIPGAESSSSPDVHPIDQSAETALTFSQLCDYILLLLAKDCKGRNQQFDPSQLNWAFKFYLSHSKSNFPGVGRKLLPLHKETFEQFEVQFRQHLLEHQKTSSPNSRKMEHLLTALKDITADIPWDNPEEKSNVVNRVFVFTNLPESDAKFVEFSGNQKYLDNYKTFIKVLFPKEYYKYFQLKYKIQLNFIDVGMKSECPKILHDLTHHFQLGRVTPFSTEAVDSMVPSEYPSYCHLLRQALIVHAPKVSPRPFGNSKSSKVAHSHSFSVVEDISRRSSSQVRNLRHSLANPPGYGQDYYNPPVESDRESVISAIERAKFSRRMEDIVHQGQRDIAKSHEKVVHYLERMAPPRLRERPADAYGSSNGSVKDYSRSRAMMMQVKHNEMRRKLMKNVEKPKETTYSLHDHPDSDSEDSSDTFDSDDMDIPASRKPTEPLHTVR